MWWSFPQGQVQGCQSSLQSKRCQLPCFGDREKHLRGKRILLRYNSKPPYGKHLVQFLYWWDINLPNESPLVIVYYKFHVLGSKQCHYGAVGMPIRSRRNSASIHVVKTISTWFLLIFIYDNFLRRITPQLWVSHPSIKIHDSESFSPKIHDFHNSHDENYHRGLKCCTVQRRFPEHGRVSRGECSFAIPNMCDF